MTLHLFIDEIVCRQGALVSSDTHRKFFHLLPRVGGLGRKRGSFSDFESAGKSRRLEIVY